VLFYYYTGGIVLNFLSQYTFFGSKKYDRLHFLEPKRVFMKRHIIKELCQWQKSTRRKPLIVMGARQVGKTTSLKHFAATYYKNSVYLNFEDEPHLKSLFEGSLNPNYLLKAIKIEKETAINPGDTLIVFDEIQACPRALNSLKYFHETANEYHVASAGSLLGVKLLNTEGFPVGKVDFLDMYPLSFFEFLKAIGKQELEQFLSSLSACEPLPGNIHETCLSLFRDYLYIGGMPEAIATYLETDAFDKVREVHDAILRGYSLDFSKHAPSDQIMKINQVWQNIPSQLAKENKKFIYSILRKGARAKEFEMAIQWLNEARLVYKTYQVSTPKIPLKAYAQFEFFKIYLLDAGLLGAMTNLSAQTLLRGNQLFQEFKGAYIETFVAQTLRQLSFDLYYWTSEGKAELDFMMEYDGLVYPLEVKSGSSNKKKSLLTYAQKYQPHLTIRVSPMNLCRQESMLNCPLYLLEQLPQLMS